jgi:iron complex transport system substrate-binding protein
MRIVSFLASATEIVHELGLGDSLVGISHECDYPLEALRLPRLSRSRVDPTGLDSAEIDHAVRRAMEEYGSVFKVDVDALRAARPELILTQGVCEVCAVPTGSVEAAVAQLDYPVRVLPLDAHTLEEILHTILQVAEAAGVPGRGEEVVSGLRARIDAVAGAVAGTTPPRVLGLEWLDPPFAPGHWVPEMIEAAGGQNLRGTSGGASREVAPAELTGLDPDHLLLIPCGYDLEAARQDAERRRAWLYQTAAPVIEAGNAWIGHSAYFSRSGPRVVTGIEALARVFHPTRFPDAPAPEVVERWR